MQSQLNIRVGTGLTDRTAAIFVESLQSVRDNVDLTIQIFEVFGLARATDSSIEGFPIGVDADVVFEAHELLVV